MEDLSLWQIVAKVLLELELKSIRIIFTHLSNKLTLIFFNSCDHIVAYIAVLLPMQQFNITKIMMFTFSIIVILSYLYFVCLVC